MLQNKAEICRQVHLTLTKELTGEKAPEIAFTGFHVNSKWGERVTKEKERCTVISLAHPKGEKWPH